MVNKWRASIEGNSRMVGRACGLVFVDEPVAPRLAPSGVVLLVTGNLNYPAG